MLIVDVVVKPFSVTLEIVAVKPADKTLSSHFFKRFLLLGPKFGESIDYDTEHDVKTDDCDEQEKGEVERPTSNARLLEPKRPNATIVRQRFSQSTAGEQSEPNAADEALQHVVAIRTRLVVVVASQGRKRNEGVAVDYDE